MVSVMFKALAKMSLEYLNDVYTIKVCACNNLISHSLNAYGGLVIGNIHGDLKRLEF